MNYRILSTYIIMYRCDMLTHDFMVMMLALLSSSCASQALISDIVMVICNCNQLQLITFLK